jgi:uncharacterized membrane protein YeiH
MLVYWLDILGTAVFAISGVLLAGKLRMDPFGVLVLGALADGIGPPFAIAGFALLGLVFLALVAFATRR